ncbi:MAG: hypothetical protein COA43_15690 [Robiginitomaculum sp.]|nr:MAG: hypothetical protein COA43_15690 [Robiginitomaculum sp.]
MKAMSSELLLSFAQTCLSQGVDEYELFKLIPGGWPALNTHGTWFDISVLKKVFSLTASTLNLPHIGLIAGQNHQLSVFQDMGRAYMFCRSLQEIVTIATRYQPIYQQFGKTYFKTTGSLTAIIWDIGTADVEDSRVLTDAAMANHMLFGRRLNWDPAQNAHAIHFCHKAPIYASAYEDFFQCPVLFSQKQNAIILSTKTFIAPLAQPNDNLLHEMCLRLDKALLSLENTTTITTNVSQYLRNVLSLGAPTLAQTAQELGLSERSLRRRLMENGTCFRVLLEHTRRELCQDFLQDQSLSFTKIGERLGYSEQSAFNRAFKNWYGLTPKRYAKKLHAFDKIIDCF